MKTIQQKIWITLSIAFVAVGTQLEAQPYGISWFTMDGGGGASSGGNYSLTGSLGQPDAGVLQGGTYALVGGYWGALVPIQVAGAPMLTIAVDANGAVISWAPSSAGFILQYREDLSAGDWINAATADMNPVAVPFGSNVRFFRLHKP